MERKYPQEARPDEPDHRRFHFREPTKGFRFRLQWDRHPSTLDSTKWR